MSKVLPAVMLLAAACTPGPLIGPVGGGAGGGGGTGGGPGGGSATGGGAADAGLKLASACSTLNTRRCEYYARCGLIEATDPALRDCVALLLATWCGPTRWPARVEIGTLIYDPLSAQSCADAWATRECGAWETLPQPCGRLHSPNVAPLQSCYDGYLECTEGVCRGAACPRTCQRLPGMVGEVCQLNPDCAPSLYCKRAVMATGAGTCTAFGTVMSLCSADEPCGASLVCSGGRCTMPPGAGSGCPFGVCDDTSWCQTTNDGGICAPRQTLGGACTDDVQCLSGHLCQMGQCEPHVLGRFDSDCSDRQICPTGTLCIGATATKLGKCQAPLAKGALCVNSGDCQANLACAPSDGGVNLACDLRLENSERCTVDRDCQILSRCIGGLCTRLPTLSQSCTDTHTCLFGPCVNHGDAGSFCDERLDPGQRCTRDDECTSDRCVGGTCLSNCAP